MPATLPERLGHILEAISNIRKLLDGRQRGDVETDPFLRAAFERFLEIISEASRYIPAEMRERHACIEWIDVRNIGNRLRHGDDGVDVHVLWDIYEKDIDMLERAVRAMLTAAS